MTIPYTGTTNRANPFIVAKCAVVFQKLPGVGDDKIIKNAGDGILWLQTKAKIKITPVNGVYAIPLEKGDKGSFELMGIKYNIESLEKTEKDDVESPSIIHWQNPLHDINKLVGVQQRLQILGFYEGKIDGFRGRLTEKAVLNFQTEEGTIVIDGDPGTNTKNALDTYFKNNSSVSVTGMPNDLPVIRKSFIEIQRGITGPTQFLYPHPDYRGSTTTELAFGRVRDSEFWKFFGINTAENKSMAVGIHSLYGLTLDKKIVPKLVSGSSINIPSYNLKATPNGSDFIFGTLDIGKSTIGFHYGDQTGPVIGELNVDVVPLVNVKVTVHIVTVKDSSNNFSPHNFNEASVKSLFHVVNAIWITMGIKFDINVRSYTKVGAYSDTLTDDVNLPNDDREPIKLSGEEKVRNTVNFYFFNKMQDIDSSGNIDTNTNAYSWGSYGIFCRANTDQDTLARTIAHELGHRLGITRHAKSHTDHATDGSNFRHDIWSRTRLMGRYAQYGTVSPNREWQDTGYGTIAPGKMKKGAMLTIKKFANDDTDGELDVSRKTAKDESKVYK